MSTLSPPSAGCVRVGERIVGSDSGGGSNLGAASGVVGAAALGAAFGGLLAGGLLARADFGGLDGFDLGFGVAFFFAAVLVLATRGRILDLPGPEAPSGGEYLAVSPRFRGRLLNGGVGFARGLTAAGRASTLVSSPDDSMRYSRSASTQTSLSSTMTTAAPRK